MSDNSSEISNFQSLQDTLNAYPNHRLPEAMVQNLLHQVLLQLKWLHDQDKVHGSISLDTIGFHDNQIRLLASGKFDSFGDNKSSSIQDLIDLGSVAIALLTGKTENLASLHKSWESDCLVSDQLAVIINFMIGRNGNLATTVDQILPYFGTEVSTTKLRERSPSQLNSRLISISAVSLVLVAIAFGIFKFLNTRTGSIESQQMEVINYLQALSQAQTETFNQDNEISTEVEDLNVVPITDNSYEFKGFSLNETTVLTTATAHGKGLKSYALVTFVTEDSDKQLSMQSIICQTVDSSEISPQLPSLEETAIACPDGSELVNPENSPDGITHFVQTGKILTALPQPTPQPDDTLPEVSPLPVSSSNPPTVRTQRVQFIPGTTGTTLQGAAVNNRLENFLLQLGKGQQMTVSIAQGNVLANVYAPNGSLIGQASNQNPFWRGLLPSSGDYTLEISGSDNSTYLVDIDVVTIAQNNTQNNNSGISPSGVAIVFDPPSNIRDRPNGSVLCSVQIRKTINIYGSSGEWYRTDACGSTGFIHNSQLQF